jgi:hypothetical protein
MKRATAQRFLIACGILALLGGGSCSLAFLRPGYSAITFGLFGLGGLVIAVILGIIGLIGLIIGRRDN